MLASYLIATLLVAAAVLTGAFLAGPRFTAADRARVGVANREEPTFQD